MKAKVALIRKEEDGSWTIGFLVKTDNKRYVYREENVIAADASSAADAAFLKAKNAIASEVQLKSSLPPPRLSSTVGRVKIEVVDFHPVIGNRLDGWAVSVVISAEGKQAIHGFFLPPEDVKSEDDILNVLLSKYYQQRENQLERMERETVIGREYDLT